MTTKALAKRPTRTDERRQRFIAEYCLDMNGTAAAVRAGYSPKGADVAAIRLLGDARVAGAIRERLRRVYTRLDLSTELVMREQARIGLADIRNYVSWNDTGEVAWTPSADLSENQARAVKAFTVTKKYDKEGNHIATETKLELHPKQPALDSLAKHLGSYKADNDQKGIAGLLDLIREASMGPVIEGVLV